MGIFELLKSAFPEWAAKWIACGAVATFVVYRLWCSAWSLTARHKRQDAMEEKVSNMERRVVRLSRHDKRKGLRLALMMKAQEDQARRQEEHGELLSEIRDLLMHRGASSG